MIEKIKTAVWFLKNPKYIPQVFQVLKRSSNADLENSSQESLTWCQDNCIEQTEALEKLIKSEPNQTLKDIFPEDVKWAKEQEAKCPYKMGGEGASSFLFHIVAHKKPLHILETGVAYGWSSFAILLALEKNGKGRLISNDMPYIKMNNDSFVGCVVPKRIRNNWHLQRMADVNGIPKAIKKFNEQIDLIHYDSDKSYSGRMWSGPLLWKYLSDGGLFISDDINDNLGFKHFCEQVNRTPIVFEHEGKYVGIITK